MIVVNVQSYYWVLSFDTEQSCDVREKNLSPQARHSVQLCDNHLFTVAAPKGSCSALIKILRESGNEQIRAHQQLPHKPTSWNGPDSGWAPCWKKNNRDDKLAAVTSFTKDSRACTSAWRYSLIKTCRDKSLHNELERGETEAYYCTWFILIFSL